MSRLWNLRGLALVLLLPAAGCVAAEGERKPDVQWVPTPQVVVDRMLSLAEVDENDLIYDLGSGDGRIVITAATRYGTRGVGIDIDPDRIADARANAEMAGVSDLVEFVEADLFETDLSEATVVTLYLLNSLNRKLRPKLLEELEPGTPVVSHAFDMGEWTPDITRSVEGKMVYMWVVPARLDGRWELSMRGDNGEQQFYVLDLEQDFQHLSGIADTSREGPIEVRDGRLAGKHVSFTLSGPDNTPRRFDGEVNGNSMSGTVEDGAGRTLSWRAERRGTAVGGL